MTSAWAAVIVTPNAARAAAEITNLRIVLLPQLDAPRWVPLISHKNYISKKININKKIISFIREHALARFSRQFNESADAVKGISLGGRRHRAEYHHRRYRSHKSTHGLSLSLVRPTVGLIKLY